MLCIKILYDAYTILSNKLNNFILIDYVSKKLAGNGTKYLEVTFNISPIQGYRPIAIFYSGNNISPTTVPYMPMTYLEKSATMATLRVTRPEGDRIFQPDIEATYGAYIMYVKD